MPYSQFNRKLQLRVAYLKAKGWQQNQIAAELNIPEVQVSRVLKAAKANGFLEANPRFDEKKCTPKELAELKLGDRLEGLLPGLQKVAAGNGIDISTSVSRIHVMPHSASGVSPADIRQRLALFAAFSAPDLIQRLGVSKLCGVTWGFTVASVVEALEAYDCSVLKPHNKRTFIATCGEPYSMEPESSSSSRIVLKLNRLQEGNTRTAFTLTGVPAFIPPEFDYDAILPFIHRHTAFGMIFGSSALKRRRAKINKLDTVITSVGAIAKPTSTFHDELVRKSGLNADELKELTFGDIGGVSMERGGLDEEDQVQFRKISKMWIGITLHDLRKVVERAAEKKKPGVVVLTIGKHKARVVYEAVRRGLVSELFIDQDLAFALADLIKKPPSD